MFTSHRDAAVGGTVVGFGAVAIALAAVALPYLDLSSGSVLDDNRFLNQGPGGHAGLTLLVAAGAALANLVLVLSGRRQNWAGIALAGVVAMGITAWTLRDGEARAAGLKTSGGTDVSAYGISRTTDPGPAVWVAAAGGLMLLVGALSLRRTAPAPEATKKCPSCAELVLSEAKLCKHCGERFSEPPILAPAS